MTVRRWLAVSAVFLVVQVALMPSEARGTAGQAGWLVIGGALLLLVLRRRSRLARGVVVVGASFGAVVWALTATDPLGWLVALAFAGQALPLLTRVVRRHVQAPSAAAEVAVG